MLKWMRGKRFDMKTTVFVLVVAAVVWAIFVYVNARDLVPPELTEPAGETRQP